MKSTQSGTGTNQVIKSILFCAIFTGAFVLFSFLTKLFPAKFERFSYGIVGTVVALLITWIFLRFDKKTFGEIGLTWERMTLSRFFAGLVIGLALSIVMILALVYFAGLKLELSGNYNVTSFLLWALALIPLALMEEIAFRAYPFVNLKRATGIRITQVIIAIMFALYHVAGGQSISSAFLGPGVWAFVFGLAAVMSGGISLPTGLHFGANLFLAAIGQQKGFESIWSIGHSAEITPAIQQNIENIGTILQLVLLVVTIGVMEWYIRKKN